ncbi:MAG: DUF4249 domain-containing protein [Bacteroidia bacterium]|nr:DUF4249 domain-containing protein [Bacteroidia bacterium]
MKSITTYLIFASLLLIFISCKKYIDMKIPDKGRKPVINCLFSADSTFKVQVFQSHFILDDAEPQEINNAIVTISENETIIDTLVYSSHGYYSSNSLIPSIGKNYKISASFNDKTANSSATIPNPVSIINIDTTSYHSQNGNYFRFNLQINDPADETNYYLIKIEKSFFDYYSGNTVQNIYLNYSDDPSLDATWQGSFVVNDNLFNGKTKTFPLDIDIFNLYNYNDSASMFNISLYSISKDYYLYAKTVESQTNSGNSPFSEPVMVYNNIENGYGIFAGASLSRQSMAIPSRQDGGFPNK